MRWFKRKKQRGASKSPLTKAKEQQAKLDTHLMKIYLDDLRANPTFAREIAREKYGLSTGSEGDYTGEPQPDILDTIRKANEARDLIRGEDNTSKGNTLMAVAKIMEQLPKAAELLSKLQQAQQPQPTQRIVREEQPQITRPEPEQIEEPKTKEEKLTFFAEQLMAMTPTEAAVSIYQFKDEADDIRSMIYSYVTENDFDSIVDSIPLITSHPGNEFLVPLAGKLDKKWMALVYDELNTLRKKEEAQ